MCIKKKKLWLIQIINELCNYLNLFKYLKKNELNANNNITFLYYLLIFSIKDE